MGSDNDGFINGRLGDFDDVNVYVKVDCNCCDCVVFGVDISAREFERLWLLLLSGSSCGRYACLY